MKDNLVYHYCNVSAAMSILKEKEIWLTDIRNLSDGNESIGVYKMFFNLLEKQDTKRQLISMLECSKESGAIQLYETPLGAYPEYIACFSKNPDLVSQWIAYADDGQGLAIGFDEKSFNDITDESILEYKSVSYVSVEDIEKHIPDIYKFLMDNLSNNKYDMMDKAMKKIKQLYPSGMGIKTMHYASEQEKRIIYRYPEKIELPEGWKINGIKTYAKRNMINTYIPLSFPKDAIKKIIVGPKYQKNYCEFQFAMEALEYTKLEICESTSGYR